MCQIFFISISNQVHEPDFLSYIVSFGSVTDTFVLGNTTIFVFRSRIDYTEVVNRIQSYNARQRDWIKVIPFLSSTINKPVVACQTDEFVVTVLGKSSFDELLKLVSATLNQFDWSCTDVRVHQGLSDFVAIDIVVVGQVSQIDVIRKELKTISLLMRCDIMCQPKRMFDCPPKLVCFDMDSTLIQAEMIDELAKIKNIGSDVAQITEAAMRGEIDFAESFRQRTQLLAGLSTDEMNAIASRVLLTETLDKTVSVLKLAGCKLAILSGGFSFFCNYFKERLGFDYAFGTEPEIGNNYLTGKLLGDIMDAKGKASALIAIAECEGIDLSRTVCVGDGANDLLMLQTAGRGVAYHGKPKLIENVDFAISYTPMCSLLYMLGLNYL